METANCGASEITRRGFGPAAHTGRAPIASKSVGAGMTIEPAPTPLAPGSSQSGNCQWCAAENCLKTNLTPFAPFHRTNPTLPLLICSLGFFSSLSCLTFQNVRQSVQHFLYQGETTATPSRFQYVCSAPASSVLRRLD